MGRGAIIAPLRYMRDVIWPRVCEVCGTPLVEGERTLCLKCDIDMPRVGASPTVTNQILERLACHAPIDAADAYIYYYPRTPYANLITRAKYNMRPQLARDMGRMFAKERPEILRDIDLILPVPIHWWKRMRRGYNQTEEIARGMSEIVPVPVGDHLKCGRHHASQTHKGQYARWLNAHGLYHVTHPEELHGKRLLIIDDVITSGATMISCREALHTDAPTATVSVAALGLTHLR